MDIQEAVSMALMEMNAKLDELIMDALNHFQVNIEDIPWRCLKKDHPQRTEFYIDATLVLTIDRTTYPWKYQKHY